MTPLELPLDYAAIERILPHRYPFLLVDRVTECEPDKRIVGVKNVSLNERYLWHGAGKEEEPVLPATSHVRPGLNLKSSGPTKRSSMP